MRFDLRKLTIALTALMLICGTVFAQSVSESNAIQDFSTMDLEASSLQSIMDSFGAAVSDYSQKYQDIYDHMMVAYRESNASDYFDAKHMLANLSAPTITKEQTQILAKRTAEEQNAELQAEFAQWLYSNSRYYRPVITFTSSSASGSFSSSYRYSVSVFPGSKVTVPTVKLGNKTSELAGWGLTEDEVLYKAGDEITMPYDSLTLYAVFQSTNEGE